MLELEAPAVFELPAVFVEFVAKTLNRSVALAPIADCDEPEW